MLYYYSRVYLAVIDVTDSSLSHVNACQFDDVTIAHTDVYMRLCPCVSRRITPESGAILCKNPLDWIDAFLLP